MQYISDKTSSDVAALYSRMHAEDPTLTQSQFANLVWKLNKERKVSLEERRSRTTLTDFLRHWEKNMYFYASLLFAIVAVLTIYLVPSSYPFQFFRMTIGSIFMLFIPGYVAVNALFGFADLNLIERIALSIGISAALTMFIGVLLNYTVWGVTMTPLVISITLVMLCLDFAALLRHYYFG